MSNNIQNIINKIKHDYNEKLESVKREFIIQKKEAETECAKEILKQKNILKDKYDKLLEVEKNKISTEIFLDYVKNIEQEKRKILDSIFNDSVNQIKNISKQEYYEFIKKLILNNLFYDSENFVLFDNSIKLSIKDKHNLLKEIKELTKHKHGKKFSLDLAEIESDFDFGIKITSEKRVNDLTLSALIETLRDTLEVEVSRILFE